MITAKKVADSLSPQKHRLTTMEAVFPRIVLAEFNTHRVFTRNSASSRAIPFVKMVRMVMKNPFIPIAWQKSHSGMQGTEYLDPDKVYLWEEIWETIHNTLMKCHENANVSEMIELEKVLNETLTPLFYQAGNVYTLSEWWLKIRDLVVGAAIILHAMGVTKQLCNRLLEPFMYHKVLVTATEWENFFKLRCPQYFGKFRSKKDFLKDQKINNKPGDYSKWTDLDWFNVNTSQAEIHIQALAEAMWDAMNESTPKQLEAGQWHVVYKDQIDSQFPGIDVMDRVKVATMMAARVSYSTFDDGMSEWTLEKYLEKEQQLRDSDPPHSSPQEHCARAMDEVEYCHWTKTTEVFEEENETTSYPTQGWCRNFRGFIQYRELVEKQ